VLDLDTPVEPFVTPEAMRMYQDFEHAVYASLD
jgi:hypothetical protein